MYVTQRHVTHCVILSILFVLNSIWAQPVIVESIVPQDIQGRNGTNTQRIPCSYWVSINGLTANATYRYYNQVVRSSDSPTTDGAGNSIFTNQSGFVRTSSPGFATQGNYGEFISDATGSYGGWMITEPTGNARFVPGQYIFFRIMLNDGANGTTVATRLTTLDSVRVLKLDTAPADSAGTGIRAHTFAAARDFVLLYDNITGIGRPLASTFIENDGSDNSASNNYVAFYSDSVNLIDGAFGAIIPNSNGNGVRRVERRAASGIVLAFNQSGDGHWPSGANTINPSGGTTPVVLTIGDVPLNSSDAIGSMPVEKPTKYTLLSAYPNPFNSVANIRLDLPLLQRVKLMIYDATGRWVATLVDGEAFPAGRHEVQWNGTSVSSGTYFVTLKVGDFSATKKLILIK